jgi:hypothetical protein
MKRKLLWTLCALVLASWLVLLGYYLVSEFGPFGPIISDVSKRLESPDGTKTALLIRRKAFDLNFVVMVRSGLKTSTLYFSPDYNTDPKIDWNEKIKWSGDSSVLVFSTDAVPPFGPEIWAFDFQNNTAVKDREKVRALLNERQVK